MNTDKVFNYWKNSYDLQKRAKPNNNLKINNITNHEGLYELEETSNIDGKVFIKQYKLNREDLIKFINSKKNYKIYYANSNEIVSKNINKSLPQNTTVHPEYRNNVPNIHLDAYRCSYNQRFK